jgi:hypothetical protein
MHYIFIIQKPNSMIKWYTSNPDIARYANGKDWSVKCIN